MKKENDSAVEAVKKADQAHKDATKNSDDARKAAVEAHKSFAGYLTAQAQSGVHWVYLK